MKSSASTGRAERMKVPISRWPASILLVSIVHALAVLGACVIISLNVAGVWIGKELQGSINEDGKKRFGLQLAAKGHEIFIVTSLSHMLCAVVLKFLARGETLPFAALGAGLRVQSVSFLFSKEYTALCLASFQGRLYLVTAIALCGLLGVTVGPSSATAMIPTSTDWSAGKTDFMLNATQQELWPSDLAASTDDLQGVTISDGAWQSLQNNLFAYWGHETLGGVLAAPEIVNIPSHSSVRTMNVRFRGPFSLFQPDFTTATIQPSAVSNALSNLRLLWFGKNANRCSWANVRAESKICTYKDLVWSIRSQQPVVSAACRRSNMLNPVSFPTLARDPENEKIANLKATIENRDLGTNSTSVQCVSLNGSDFTETSVGLLLATTLFSASATSEWYACSIDAQWGVSDIQTNFLGSPYVVNGMPPSFFAQNISGSAYQGVRVKIEPSWASQLLNQKTENESAQGFSQLLLSGQPSTWPESESKIEAVLAAIVAEAMASTGSNAVIQVDGDVASATLASFPLPGNSNPTAQNSHLLTMRTTVTGYAFGLRTADGVSISAILSVIVLSIYILVTLIFLSFDLFSRTHVNAWNNLSDILTLALHSPPPSELENTSAGVDTLDSLSVPVSFMERFDGVEMVFGHRAVAHHSKLGYRPLQKEKAYA